MTKYEKLEAEYSALETPEQQWAWVLAHKDEVKLFHDNYENEGRLYAEFVKDKICRRLYINDKYTHYGRLLTLLAVLGIEAEGV